MKVWVAPKTTRKLFGWPFNSFVSEAWIHNQRGLIKQLRKPAKVRPADGSPIRGSFSEHTQKASSELPGSSPGSRSVSCSLAQSACNHRVIAGVQVLPAQVVAAKLLQNPAQLSLLCSSLQESFAFDPAAAGLLLYATADAGPHLSIPAAQSSSDSLVDESSSALVGRAPAAAEADGMGWGGQHTGVLDVLGPQQGSLSAPMLPRMPAGLAHMGSQQCYEALAAVARSIGRVAYQSGLPSVLPLH